MSIGRRPTSIIRSVPHNGINTGHTDAVEHEIDTGDGSPIRCAPRRMSPQKMKKEEECVAEMQTGGQVEPSDSPWSSPVLLVRKKDGGTGHIRETNGGHVAWLIEMILSHLGQPSGMRWII